MENLFPERFGPDNLRYSYSYNGSYFYRKKALDPSRLRILKRYLLYFYPELKDSALYQRTVIDSANTKGLDVRSQNQDDGLSLAMSQPTQMHLMTGTRPTFQLMIRPCMRTFIHHPEFC